ncbi:hypothetical protein LWU70_10290 [Enterobacter hormaechei]|nr:hypothetical protein [Enterobacter hormaechei]
MENLVRFAALVSVTGFMTGLSSGHPYVQLIEFFYDSCMASPGPQNNN